MDIANMNITDLHIHHFRNLSDVHLTPNHCNIFMGKNGSGKTSILESIHLLSRGKSFRHHQPKHYIQHGYQNTTIVACLDDADRIAIDKRHDASTQLRLNGQTLLTQSPFAQLLPTLLLEPLSLAGLNQGSQTRRELFDWLLFHVEPLFHPTWLTYQRLLKQRNNLLKSVLTIDALTHWQRQEILAWDSELSHQATIIHEQRESILAKWQPYFEQQVAKFLPQYANRLRLRYSVGFDCSIGLATILAERLASDIELGYTRLGSHRADINVVLDQNVTDELGHHHKQVLLATDVLSRGENKLLMMAFRLSQLPLLNLAGKIPLVLLDDITAELDEHALMLLLTSLKEIQSQLFITSLSTDLITMVRTNWQDAANFYQVNDGQIDQFDAHENLPK